MQHDNKIYTFFLDLPGISLICDNKYGFNFRRDKEVFPSSRGGEAVQGS
jgi:hypothetical protein